jgi:hypothetical protein
MNLNSMPTILMRTTAPEGEIISVARGIFHDLVPDVPVKFSTFAMEVGGWFANRRFLLVLVGLLAAAALVLTSVGLYGVIAFFVACRTQEIGVRMAVGPQRSDVLRLVLGEGARLAALGVVRHGRVARDYPPSLQSPFWHQRHRPIHIYRRCCDSFSGCVDRVVRSRTSCHVY